MPSYDYEVDLESMGQAAQGLSETLQLFKDKDVEDLVPSKGDIGSDVVWDALDEFKGRWRRASTTSARTWRRCPGASARSR